MNPDPQKNRNYSPVQPALIGAVVEWTEDNRPMPDQSGLIGEDACFDMSLVIKRTGTVMAVAANHGDWKVLIAPLDGRVTKRKGAFEEVPLGEIRIIHSAEEIAKKSKTPKKPLLNGRFPFSVIRDRLTGYESIHCRVYPPSAPPTKTGLILVALWGKDEYALVRVTEMGYEYAEEGDEPASPAEWQWWLDLSTFTFLPETPLEDQQHVL